MNADGVRALRGRGRWEDALELVDDPVARADLLNKRALFAGDADARSGAERELDRAEAWLCLGRGRVLHARFLAEREEDPRELELFERALERDGYVPGVAAGLLTLAEVAFERGREAEGREPPGRARDLAKRSGANAFVARIEAAATEHGL